jgi:hypothetical protein
MYFPLLHFHQVAKARDDLYTLVSNFDLGEPYCASFDLSPELYKQFLEAVTPKQRALIESAMSQHPWSIWFEQDYPEVTVGAVLAGYKVTNTNEEYAPLKIVEIRKL